MKSWGKYLRIGAINILVLVVLLAMIEAAIRVLYPQIRLQGIDENLVADKVYDNTPGLKPNVSGYAMDRKLTVNKWGFRSTTHEPDTAKKSKLLIGDSVTLGVGVEDDSTFSGILQHHYPEFNLLNASFAGYTVSDYENIITRLSQSQEYKINQVLLFYCLNDLYLKSNAGIMLSKNRFIGKVFQFLKTHSYFYIWLKGSFFDRPKAYYQHDVGYYNKNGKEFTRAMKQLIRIDSICRQNHWKFSVLILPYEFQLRQSAGYYNPIPQRNIKRKLRDAGISVYDPLPFLNNNLVDSGSAYLFADGIHFSEKGHRLIAKYLLKKDVF